MTTITIASIVFIATMLIAAALRERVNRSGGCPECSTPVPMFRTPTSLRQFMWGGWTCSKCGTEMDRSGKLLTE